MPNSTKAYNASILSDYINPTGLAIFPSVVRVSGSLLVQDVPVSVSGHNHVVGDIVNFDSTVSGLLPNNIVTGVGTSGYSAQWNSNNSLTSGIIFSDQNNVGIGTTTPNSTLHVVGSGIFTSGVRVGDSAANSYIIGPSGNTYIRFNSGANNSINIGSNTTTGSSAYLDTQFTYLNSQATYVNGSFTFPAAGNNPTNTATQQDSNSIRLFNKLWDGSAVMSPSNEIISKASTTSNLSSRLAFLMQNGDGTQNRTERVSISNNGNVGIGTTNPQNLIHISGSTANAAGIRIDNADGMAGRIDADNGVLYFSSSTATVCRMQAAKIRLGDGVTAAAIELTANGTISQDGNGGGLSFSGTTARLSNGMHITGGSLGVGTTSPSGQLHIVGSSIFDGDISATGLVAVSSGSILNPSYQFIGDPNTGAFSPAVDTFAISTSGVERLRINDIGNVGINALPQAGFKLDVGGASVIRGNIATNGAILEFSNNRYQLQSTANSNSYSYVCNGGGNFGVGFAAPSGRVAISGGVSIGSSYNITPPTNGLIVEGNTGIGTITPSGRLHVVGSGLFSTVSNNIAPNALLHAYSAISGDLLLNVEGTNGSLFSITDNLSGSLMSVNNNAGLPIFEVFSDDSIVAGRFNQNDFVISSGGNIGIGKTNPSVKLDIVGGVAVSGAFSATTKSFKINHPSKSGYILEYGSLESPYHGVRLTGKDTVVNGICIVSLPDYIKDLVHDDNSVNIQITNYRHSKIIYVQNIILHNNQFIVSCDNDGLYDFFWTFTGLRKDISQIMTEYLL